MMFFFDTVQTFSASGKSGKGQLLQEMAKRFERVLVQGEDAPLKIVLAMREKAQILDARFSRGRATYVDYTFDRSGDYGQITAYPVSDNVDFDKQPYFRLFFHKVARTATIPEAIALTSFTGGGEQ